MVVKDSSHSNVSKKEILRDLTPLVKQLAPGDYDDEVKILFEDKPDDGIKKRQIVNQVTSALTGPIVVDDVIFKITNHGFPAKDLQFRRLTSQSLVQSEALLSGEVEKNKVQANSRTRKKGKQEKASSGVMKVNHNSLESSYHKAIISGLFLFSFHLKGLAKAMNSGLIRPFQLKAVVVGLRVVELDPVILDVARDYFDFREDERLKVHITDAITFVREKLADSDAEGEGSSKVDILIVDVDSPNSTPGFTCPPAEFFEESFLLAVKNSLSEEGLFIINFISWSSAVRDTVFSRLKMVFSKLYSFQPEDNIYEVIFALKTDSPINEDDLSKDCDTYSTLFESESEEWTQRIIGLSTLIKPLDNEESKFSLAETL